MKRHWNYAKYLLRHKWFVMVACRRVGLPMWVGLTHDLSKFLPSEWLAYARTFYNEDGSKRYAETEAFKFAWNAHQKRNRHHWQYWMLTFDSGATECLPMPTRYVLEMVADWMGAGRAITGQWEAREWYAKNRDKMLLHPQTREHVEWLLEYEVN